METIAQQLLEVVTPRTNAALVSSAENLFSGISSARPSPVSLEVCSDHTRHRFLVRTDTQDERRRLVRQIGASYPQAHLRELEPGGAADTARLDDDEQLAACTLRLHAAPYLPIRTFRDRDLDADAGPAQSDPILGILAAVSDLPPGWRGLAQLVVLEGAPAGWANAYQRRALESPIQTERSGSHVSFAGPLLLLGLLGVALVGSSAISAWQRGDRTGVLVLVLPLAALAGGSLTVRRQLGGTALYEPRLVAEKLSCAGCLVELRLAILAPAFAPPERVQERLEPACSSLSNVRARFRQRARPTQSPGRTRSAQVIADRPWWCRSPERA
jgi:hypothetical protein